MAKCNQKVFADAKDTWNSPGSKHIQSQTHRWHSQKDRLPTFLGLSLCGTRYLPLTRDAAWPNATGCTKELNPGSFIGNISTVIARFTLLLVLPRQVKCMYCATHKEDTHIHICVYIYTCIYIHGYINTYAICMYTYIYIYLFIYLMYQYRYM